MAYCSCSARKLLPIATVGAEGHFKEPVISITKNLLKGQKIAKHKMVHQKCCYCDLRTLFWHSVPKEHSPEKGS